MIRIYIVLFVIGIIMAIGIERYFENSYQHKIKIQEELSLLQVHSIYDAVIDTYMTAAQKDFNSLLSNKVVMDLLQAYKYAQPLQKNIIRGRLYRLLYKQYEEMKALHVRQFHIHTHQGNSLLRFHIPYESGDPLLNLRTTIYKANIKFEMDSGFEGGRIYPGYRYVFPTIYKDDHLGSVEFSISFEGIEAKLKGLMPDNIFQLIMTKESSVDRAFKWHQSFFSQSKWDENYYVESPILSAVNRNNQENILSKIVNFNSDIKQLLSKQKSFSSLVINNGKGYFVNFLEVKNTDDKHAGYIVSLSEHENMVSLRNEINIYTLTTIFSLIIILILIALLIKKISQSQAYRLQLEELNLSLVKSNEKLERFIDLQDNIVILTNGKEFNFANQSFYNFFGYDNLESFQKDYACICDRFIVHKHFFSLDMVQENEQHWVESLLNLPERKRIVSVLDKNTTPHAFSVGINTFDENNYVVNFSDISDTMIEKLQFEKQATRDLLTGAYNRVYLKNSIDTISALYKDQNLKTGVLFFDIDHFKHINDTYGHDIGDSVLKELVKLTKTSLRKNDYLIRWGGEEFLVIIGVDSLESSSSVAESLRAKIESYMFTDVKTVTCSFGVAIGDSTIHIDSIISDADKKLYEAKGAGRNLVCS